MLIHVPILGGTTRFGYKTRRLSVRSFVLAALVTASAIVYTTVPDACIAAPPCLTEHLESIYRKSLAEFDRETQTEEDATSRRARESFVDGLRELEEYDYVAAQQSFENSYETRLTYSSIFNAAVAHYLDRNYSKARELLEKASELNSKDAEQQVNLALVLAERYEADLAEAALKKAIEIVAPDANDEATKGRTLLQLAMLQYRTGDWERALETLGLADDSFKSSSDVRGQAVVKAKRAVILINNSEANQGERLLLEAIGQLEKAGAVVDEATARSDLCSTYYFDVGRYNEAEPHLIRCVELTEGAGNALQLGRSLNNYGVFHLEQDEPSQAGDLFRRAIGNFRKARDPQGEAEATNNLGHVLLKDGLFDAAYEQLKEAVRLYRKAGSRWRAFDKAITNADIFILLEQPTRARYFLDIARFLLDDDFGQISRGRLLLGLGQYHLDTDLGIAEEELTKARAIFASDGHDRLLEEADHLLEIVYNRRVSSWIQRSLYAAAALLFIGWLLLCRQSVAKQTVRIWRTISFGSAFVCRSVVNSPVGRICRRVRHWWIGPDDGLGGEQSRAIRRLRVQQRRFYWSFVVVTLSVILTIEALTITLPHLSYVFESKGTVDEWPVPEDVRDQFQSLLTWAACYVVAHFVIQALTITLTFCGALLVYRAVERFVDCVLRSKSRPFTRKVDENFSLSLLDNARSNLQRKTPALLAGIVVAAILYYVSDGIDRQSIPYVGLALLFVVAVSELVRFRRIRNEIKALDKAQRPAAYEWMHRGSRHIVIAILINLFVYTYGVVPAFHYATRAIQTLAIYPLFDSTSHEFGGLVFESAKKYGLIALEGESALLFTRLREAYNPLAGAGQVWPELFWPMLPYLAFAWATIFFTRLSLPYIWTFGDLRRAWRALWITVSASLSASVIVALLDYGLNVEIESFWGWLGIVVLGIVFGTYIEGAIRSEAKPDVICEECDRPNPADAKYCNECGVKLDETNHHS